MNWKDITIEKYDRIAQLANMELSEIDYIANVIAILDNTTVKTVEELPYGMLLLKARNLRFLNDNPVPSIARKHYDIQGVKYNATLNPADLTTAQYIDFQVRAAENPEDLAGFLSIMLIPDGYKYNEGYSQEELKSYIYKNFSIEDAMGLSAFFFALWKKSIRVLTKENKKLLRKLKRKKLTTPEEKKLITATENLLQTIETHKKYL